MYSHWVAHSGEARSTVRPRVDKTVCGCLGRGYGTTTELGETMASMNRVLLVGNLTRDPELRRFGQDNAVCKLGLATNRRFTTRSGEQQEETCFVDVEVFGRQAELADQYLSTGRSVMIDGRLKLDQWEDRDTGRKRSRLLVVARRVQFLGGRRDDDDRREPVGEDRRAQPSTPPAAPPPIDAAREGLPF